MSVYKETYEPLAVGSASLNLLFSQSQLDLILTSLSYLFMHLQKGLIMGKPMDWHLLRHDINPSKPLTGSTSPKNEWDPVISALHGCSIFEQPIEVPKLVRHDQCILKTWSRDNNPSTLTCHASQVIHIWATLLQNPWAYLRLTWLASSPEPPTQRSPESVSL